jgi:hypothetical protein
MVRVLLAAFALLLAGCAGWSRDYSQRLRVERGDPELLQVQCKTVPVAKVGASGSVGVAVDGPRGRAPVGELFDWRRCSEGDQWCKGPLRQGLAVDADAFRGMVQSDVARILRLGASGSAQNAARQVVVTILDVRTSARPAGPTELRGRVSSRVLLRATIRGDGGHELWSQDFEGESEERVYYFRVIHHETTLSAAYCAALSRFGAAAPDIVRVLLATEGHEGAP